MKKLPFTLLATTSLFLTGCFNSVPKCSDTETTDLVSQIADREMTNQAGQQVASQFTYAVNAIRTTNKNEQTGAFECAANLALINNNQQKEIPITYTVEATDDGNFYVNVFGL